ncbi:MAG: hypothetical protein VXZ82_02330 [Planctomycetota bacterium]|nr:hypothetical protein [Planctomycetota bacterium]
MLRLWKVGESKRGPNSWLAISLCLSNCGIVKLCEHAERHGDPQKSGEKGLGDRSRFVEDL